MVVIFLGEINEMGGGARLQLDRVLEEDDLALLAHFEARKYFEVTGGRGFLFERDLKQPDRVACQVHRGREKPLRPSMLQPDRSPVTN